MPIGLAPLAPVTTFPGAVNAIVPTGGLLGAGAVAPAPSALPSASPVVSNPVGLAALGFLGGFALGESLVRPALGIEYPGGGGLLDYLRRHFDGNTAPSDFVAPDPPFTGGQSPGVLYKITWSTNTTSNNFVDVFPGPIGQRTGDRGDGGPGLWITYQGGEKAAAGSPPGSELFFDRFDVERNDGQPDTGGDPGQEPGSIPSGLRSPSVPDGARNLMEPDPQAFQQPSRPPRLSPVPELVPLSSPAAAPGQITPVLPDRSPIPSPSVNPSPLLPTSPTTPEITEPGRIGDQQQQPEGFNPELWVGLIDPLVRQIRQAIGTGISDLFEPEPEEEPRRLPPQTGAPDCECIPSLRDLRDEICQELDDRLPDLPFQMDIATCSPDPLLGNGWSVSQQLVPDLETAIQLLGTALANLTSYTASCPLEVQENTLVGVYYVVTAYPDYASVNFTNGGLYFIPRSGSIRFQGASGRSEEIEVHGESGWVANPNPIDFTSAVWTGKDANYTATLTEKRLSARLGRDISLTIGD